MPHNRRSFIKNVSSGITLAGLGISGTAQTLQTNFENINVGNDRDIWVKSLLKIINPVVENMASGTLKANMPLYLGPNYYLKVEKVTYLEAVGRTIAGIAPWLALPDDNSSEGILRRNTRMKVLTGLSYCVEPKHPDYLNFRTDLQPIVDAAFLAHGFLRAPHALWHPLDNVTKQRFINEFQALRDRKAYYSNWLLFSGIIEAFLMSIGENYDPVRIDISIQKFKEWYVGDGWYSDGTKFSMDYYNSFVIQPMLVDILKIGVENKLYKQEEYDIALRRMIRHAEFMERIISPEGTFPPMGRSITYRLGVFQALAQVAQMEKLPPHISQGQVRAGLTAVIQKFFNEDQNFDKNGWLLLGFNGSQPEIADQYTSTGSLYLTTLGFLPLGLSPSHSFWTDPSQPWTSQRAWGGQTTKKDYKVDY